MFYISGSFYRYIVQLDYTSLRGTEPESVYKTASNKSSILQHFYTKCPFTPIFLSVNTAGNISELTNARKNRYITEKGFFNKTIERLEFPGEFVNVISSLRPPNSKDYTISFVIFFSSCETIFLSLTLFAETSLKAIVYDF